jgi:hypothetical protein
MAFHGDAAARPGYTKGMRIDFLKTRSRILGGLLVAAVLIGLPAAQADEPAALPKSEGAAQAGSAPSTEQLARWIGDLSADEFLARDTAMLSLIDAGQPAIAAIRSQIAGRSLEATSRAMHVLEQLGLSPDVDTQEEARTALAELAEQKEVPQLARRAAGALALLTERRSAQALAELQMLGAIVNSVHGFNGFFNEEYIASVEINGDFRGTEQDLRRLKWLPDVRGLILSGEKVNDAWLKHAAQMSGLSELHLYKTSVTNEGLAPFADYNSLTELGVYYSPLGDEALDHLQKLPALNFIKLYGTAVTRPAIERFQATTGLTKVDHRKGAFLGVGCENIDGVCLIATVHANSPAQQAGLLPEDQVVRFGQAKVADFESLTAEISTLGVDDEIEVEVKRIALDDDGNTALRSVVLKVKLGPWEQELAIRNGMRP